MLIKENKKIRRCAKRIDNAFRDMQDILRNIIKQQHHGFEVEVDGIRYDLLAKPFTKEEHEEYNAKIDDMLMHMMSLCSAYALEGIAQGRRYDEAWKDVLAFTIGKGVEHYQFVKEWVNEDGEVVPEPEDKGPKPLNFDAYQVKNDLGLLDDNATE